MTTGLWQCIRCKRWFPRSEFYAHVCRLTRACVVSALFLLLGCLPPCPAHSVPYCDPTTGDCAECRADPCYQWIDGGVPGGTAADPYWRCQSVEQVAAPGAGMALDAGVDAGPEVDAGPPACDSPEGLQACEAATAAISACCGVSASGPQGWQPEGVVQWCTWEGGVAGCEALGALTCGELKGRGGCG